MKSKESHHQNFQIMLIINVERWEKKKLLGVENLMLRREKKEKWKVMKKRKERLYVVLPGIH